MSITGNNINTKSSEERYLGNLEFVYYPFARETDEQGLPGARVNILSGRLHQIIDYSGRTIEFKYHEQTGDLQEVDFSGVDIFKSYWYDRLGNLIETTDGEGVSTIYDYKDESGNENPFGEVQKLTQGALSSPGTQPPADLITTFKYDANGNVEHETSSGIAIDYSYDRLNRLTSKRYTVGKVFGPYSTTTYGYDNNSNLKTVDALGKTDGKTLNLVYEYDRLNRFTHHKLKKAGEVYIDTQLGYNKASHMNKVISPNKHRWVITPNGAGLPGKVEDELENKDEYKYYRHGLLKEVTETGAGNRQLTHTLKYNALGDIFRVGDTFRGEEKYKYEYKPVNKMLDFIKDPEGGNVSYDYDGLNRIDTVTREIKTRTGTVNADTIYKYTPNGQLERIIDAAGNFTRCEYDSKDRLTDIYYMDTAAPIHFTYTKNDQIATYTDLNGTVVTKAYDAGGRLQNRSILRGDEVVGTTSEGFTYDDLGRLSTAGNEDSLVTFDYDTPGRLVKETQELKDSEGNVTATYVVSYEYDDNGNLTHLTYPSNTDPSNPASPKKEVVYSPDELDRIDNITSGGKTIADYEYEGKAKITDKKLFNETVVMNSKFDDGRRPIPLTYKSGGKTLFDRTMTWNLIDMKMSETGSGIDKGYEYDNSWRLEKETNKSAKSIRDFSEFKIDGDENLEQIRGYTNGKLMLSLQCAHENKRHQLTRVDYINVVDNKTVEFHVVPSYDKNGNMKSFIHQYKYNFKNQLVEVVTGTGLNVEYKYDALGRRTEKIVSAPGDKEITRYVNAGWRVIEERDGNNALLRRYTYGNGIDEQVAQEYNTKNGIFTFIPMYDTTGNMIGVADDKGKLVEKYDYSTFGMPVFGYDATPPKPNSIYVGDGMFITNFSEPVKLESVTNGMKIKHEGTVIQGTFETGAGGKEIKFIPATPLQQGQMSVDLAETVEDEAGNQMGSPFSNSFMYGGTTTIVHDDSAPEVDSIKKDLNGFTITFSERIDSNTITNSIEVKKTDGSVSGSVTTIDERTVRFTPAEMLALNQEYTLWVYSTLKDLSGKSINQFFHSFMVLPDDFLVYEKPDPYKHVHSRIGNNYLFHGREYEPEVGLYFYRNRYYMPRIGRFLQPDPMGYDDSMNLYQAFNMNPINFTDPFGTIIKTEDLYKLKRIKETQGSEAAKSWIDRNPNFTSGEQLDLHMRVIFGFKDPDEFSVLDDWIASTTYDLGKPLGLESYLKFHAGVKYRQPNLQIEGLAEIGERGLLFGLFGHYVPIGVGKLAERFPWVQKTLDFLGKPIGQLFKPGGNAANTGATTATTEGSTSSLEIVPVRYRTAVSRTFEGEPVAETLTEDLVVYRYWGGKAQETGSPWFSLKPYVKAGNARRFLALPEGNTAVNVTVFKIKAGTEILKGKVASQVGEIGFGANAVGGGVQIYLPNPKLAIKIK